MQKYNYDAIKDILFLYEDIYEEKYAFSINYSHHVKLELSNEFNILSVQINHASKELNLPMELLVNPDSIELFVEKDENNELILSVTVQSMNRQYNKVLQSNH